MSFLGDTSVWPYVIAIPFLFALINLVISRAETFFGQMPRLLSIDWVSKNGDLYEQITIRARGILREQGVWRWLHWLAIFLGVSFFAWNTITCTFPEKYRPYEAREVVIMEDGGGLSHRILSEAILIPKWDTAPSEATLSWLATRIWVLTIGYIWLPIIVFKLSNIVAGVFVFTRELSRHERALNINPLSPDRSGGLSSLSALAISFTYPMVLLGIMVAMFFVKENVNPSFHNYLILIGFAPPFFLVFFLPLSGIHTAMRRTKEEFLQEYADLFSNVNRRFLEAVRDPTTKPEVVRSLEAAMRGLAESYRRGERMPVWPFETATLYRLLTGVLLPLGIPLVQLAAERLFQ